VQRLDPQLTRKPVELLDELVRHRNPTPRSFLAPAAALLPGQPDGVEVRQCRELRRSRRCRSTSVLKVASGVKRATSSAMMKWPVLHASASL